MVALSEEEEVEVTEEVMVVAMAVMVLEAKEEEVELWSQPPVDMAIHLSKRSTTKTRHKMTNLAVCRLQLPSRSSLSVVSLR